MSEHGGDLFEYLAGLTEVAKGVMQLTPESEGRVGIEPISHRSRFGLWYAGEEALLEGVAVVGAAEDDVEQRVTWEALV